MGAAAGRRSATWRPGCLSPDRQADLQPATDLIARVDESDRFLYGEQWVALSCPPRPAYAATLADRFGEVVAGGADLGSSGWPGKRWGPNALRVHITRLRHRLEPLGLEIRGPESGFRHAEVALGSTSPVADPRLE